MHSATSSFSIRSWILGGLCLLLFPIGVVNAAEKAEIAAALEVITPAKLQEHVNILADDTFEGREAGSRGGRAAGVYLGKEFQKLKLRGGAGEGNYYQQFDPGYRNILGIIEGSDPQLKKQVIVVAAHYDHVGYGTRRNSYGPIGLIHHGADDNASGDAGLLELAEACTKLPQPLKRTVLFALWDGEEKGLLGSEYWMSNPTIPLDRVVLNFNMDMIGRLRNQRVEVLGSRTGFGLRELVCRENRDINLLLDFNWELKSDSDHYSFYEHGIPTVMLFTGLHPEYHTPRDVAEKINAEGIRQVVQVLFGMLVEVGDAPDKPVFRAASRSESPATKPTVETVLPPLPPRLGIHWEDHTAAHDGLKVTAVTASSAADKAGLRVGDSITAVAGHEIENEEQFRNGVLAADKPLAVSILRGMEKTPRELILRLNGEPVRIGFSWRTDDADPHLVALNRVVPGSPAAAAGLKIDDRIYEVGGHSFVSGVEFGRLLNDTNSPVELLVERYGRLRSVEVRRLESAAEPAVMPVEAK